MVLAKQQQQQDKWGGDLRLPRARCLSLRVRSARSCASSCPEAAAILRSKHIPHRAVRVRLLHTATANTETSSLSKEHEASKSRPLLLLDNFRTAIPALLAGVLSRGGKRAKAREEARLHIKINNYAATAGNKYIRWNYNKSARLLITIRSIAN